MNEFFDPEASPESERDLGVSEVAGIFSALSSKTRIRLLFILSEKPMTVKEILEYFDRDKQSLVSQQLEVFRNEGFVKMEKVLGNRRLHRHTLTKKGESLVNFLHKIIEKEAR